jgi:hypothetical protein
VNRVRHYGGSQQPGKVCQRIHRYTVAAQPSITRQIHRGIKGEATGVIRNRYRLLRFDQAVPRKLPFRLRPKILAAGFIILAEFVHPFMPDVLQVFLISGGAVG